MECFPVPISFELFPPKTPAGMNKLMATCRQLNQFSPDYFSVTFGACGANQDKSLALVEALVNEGYEVAPHMTCIGLTREFIYDLLEKYKAWGIRRVVALRGDLPPDYQGTGGDFQYASELVSFIREKTGDYFTIEVAAYPEFHPQAENARHDFHWFKNKVEKGADAAITQYFYNIESYQLFLQQCHYDHIQVPIVPGVMPIISGEKLRRFSKQCGADLPMWLLKRLQCCEDESAEQKVGTAMVASLCRQLIEKGVPALHFYTLNLFEPTAHLIQAIRQTTEKMPLAI